MENVETFQSEVATWARQTFPDSDAGTICDHLAEEMLELLGLTRVLEAILRYQRRHAMEGFPPSVCENPAEESADILLMLLHLADCLNFDLMEAAQKKFTEVRDAEWEDEAGRGYKKRRK